ncbi:sigma factor [Pseudomonas marginalis]
MQRSIVSTSFTHLYGTHHRWLLGLLRRRLNDRWDAADLAHDRAACNWRHAGISDPTASRNLLSRWLVSATYCRPIRPEERACR